MHQPCARAPTNSKSGVARSRLGWYGITFAIVEKSQVFEEMQAGRDAEAALLEIDA